MRDEDEKGAPGGSTPESVRQRTATNGPGAGDAALRALGVAVLASVPTALRTAGAGGAFPDGLLVGAGVLLPIVGLSIILAHQAGRGFRQLAGAKPPPAALFGLALWIGIATPLLIALGAVLKATTHHRGLAGATFGVLGLAVVGGAALLAHRLVLAGRALVARGSSPRIVAIVGAAIGVLPLVVMASPLGRATDDGAAAVRAAILDGVIVMVATALAVAIDLRPSTSKLARSFGLPVALLVFFGAGARIETSHPTGRAFKAGGGLAATILGGLEAWTDRDGDGHGAHFGGDDCDEGDPNRHPGAVEIPGDGIDQDCDGIDPLPATAAAAPAGPPPVAAAKGPPPSIVLVSIDDVRFDHCGFDAPSKTTPHLAAFAAKSVSFAHAYATAFDLRHALKPLAPIAAALKEAGYATVAVSELTTPADARPMEAGFDAFKVARKRDFAARAVTKILAEHESDTAPLFLWVELQGHRKGEKDLGPADAAIGDVLAAVDASKRAGSTLTIVHGLRGETNDSNAGDAALHVPWLASWPGVVPSIDAHPIDAAELAPFVTGVGARREDPRSSLRTISINTSPIFAVNSSRAVLIDWPLELKVDTRRHTRETKLFDLSVDPKEKQDLASQREGDVTRLAGAIPAEGRP